MLSLSQNQNDSNSSREQCAKCKRSFKTSRGLTTHTRMQRKTGNRAKSYWDNMGSHYCLKWTLFFICGGYFITICWFLFLLWSFFIISIGYNFILHGYSIMLGDYLIILCGSVMIVCSNFNILCSNIIILCS